MSPSKTVEQKKVKRKEKLESIKYEVVKDQLYVLVGAVSYPFMRDNPDYEIPSKELIEIVDHFVATFLDPDDN